MPNARWPSWSRWSRTASARIDAGLPDASSGGLRAHAPQITGFSNPTVKACALRDKKHRKRAGQFLAEGLRLLTDAREERPCPKCW
jgi:hypothetical protein